MLSRLIQQKQETLDVRIMRLKSSKTDEKYDAN